jgi:hypothetical protein
MKSRTGNSLHFFAGVALMMVIGAATLCAQGQPPTTTPQHRATSSEASKSSQASDKGAGPDTLILPIFGKGTTNLIPLWTGNYTIGSSLLSQTGNGLNVAGAVTAASFAGNGAALTNVNASTLGGQSSSNFAQTGATNTFTADQTINGNLNLTGYVNSTLSLQGNLTDSNGQEGANVLGGFAGNPGFPGNSIAPGVIGATIGGGGGVYDPSLIPPPPPPPPIPQRGMMRRQRTASRWHADVRRKNNASPDTGLTTGSNSVQADWGTVGGGLQNTTNGPGSVVAGGYNNLASGIYDTVSGGNGNTASGGYDATVGGGVLDIASGNFATVAGGINNTASGVSTTVSGGLTNTASAYAATIAGGSNNSATGEFSMVAGGVLNMAEGEVSFTAGCGAVAYYEGSFVWSSTDGQGNCPVNVTQDTGADQFVARAIGGFTFQTDLSGSVGAALASGSGSWSSLSDRNAKTNFSTVDTSSLLEKLAAMPVSTWNYKTQADSIRHLGPTAQDFRAAFGLGEDDKHISSIDSEGVALASIQALYKLSQERIAELNQALSEKTRQLEDLERRLSRLEQLSDKAHSVAVVWPSK